ncbi:cytochrome P450 [Parvibaculum lavamentivorans DS-1]|uniref:Cytochrome P450 n=1 Tax=Parvibaculum lavamentivorans (strain DS-1 / DSM 13023 / NCIMB 13966) TaxID=402881 RepID=A7HP72_PARL1|nr:cytochrome P450 [Parvibaculum lavamentivorans]ABS61705.1 cytochrome P450 [Parvibaculum lavamentivorans DS-1]
MAMRAERFDEEAPEIFIPARPVPPKEAPGIGAAVFRPQLLANLIASYPEFWYSARSCPFRVGIARGGRGMLVNDPDAIRRILVSDAEHFPKDDNQLAILKPLLGNGLLTAEGATWRRNRKLAAPIFQHSSVRDFAPLFVRAAERSARRALEQQGFFPLDREMTKLTLEIIGETVLSANLEDDIDGISHTVTSVLDKFPAMFLASAFLPGQLRNRVIDTVVRPGRRALDVFARRIIDEARKSGEETTLLQRLMVSQSKAGHEMTLDQVRDEVATFLLAGHETTATTMSWVWYLLTVHPEWQERLYEEVWAVTEGRRLTIDDVPALVETRAVIEEALRLYPPVANLMRRAIKTTELTPDITIERGQTVLISPWLLHRHRFFWREPDRFDPTRFLGEEAATRPRHLYIPFGGGPRICIGASFALLEAVLILATFMQRARVKVINADQVMPQARIVLRPNVALQAVVTPRRPGG